MRMVVGMKASRCMVGPAGMDGLVENIGRGCVIVCCCGRTSRTGLTD